MKSIKWKKGMQITEPGIYEGVPIDQYHNDPELFDGPAVSKSSISKILPLLEGSPKAFWGRWNWNPERIEPDEPGEALVFGRAAHCLMLGDEVFNDRFVIRPEKYPSEKTKKLVNWSNNANFCKAWNEEQRKKGLMVITRSQIDMIRKMANDAGQYPLIRDNGLLNGKIERTLVAKDPVTGIWLKYRPDNMVLDGIHSDLKTVSKLSEPFLRGQWFDNAYFLQGAIGRMVCRLLGIPFETFVLVYVLKDDVPDTAHVEAHPEDLDLGERTIRWALDEIKSCMDADVWPGALPFGDGTVPIRMRDWSRDRLTTFLQYSEQSERAA